MSKLMWIAGTLLVAAGVALGLMFFVAPAPGLAWLSFESVAIIIVGGIVSLGIGSVISALENQPAPRVEAPAYVPEVKAPAQPIPEFGRRAQPEPAPAASVAPAATVAAASVVAASSLPELSEPTKETIQALEQARQKIEQAFDPKPVEQAAPAEAQPEPVAVESPEAPAEAELEAAEAETAEEEVLEEGQLYVVEERIIRARPARILSDGTVEAETDEGWMRFENLEHLDEYMDAMAPAARA